jgi:hypothetical protein
MCGFWLLLLSGVSGKAECVFHTVCFYSLSKVIKAWPMSASLPSGSSKWSSCSWMFGFLFLALKKTVIPLTMSGFLFSAPKRKVTTIMSGFCPRLSKTEDFNLMSSFLLSSLKGRQERDMLVCLLCSLKSFSGISKMANTRTYVLGSASYPQYILPFSLPQLKQRRAWTMPVFLVSAFQNQASQSYVWRVPLVSQMFWRKAYVLGLVPPPQHTICSTLFSPSQLKPRKVWIMCASSALRSLKPNDINLMSGAFLWISFK